MPFEARLEYQHLSKQEVKMPHSSPPDTLVIEYITHNRSGLLCSLSYHHAYARLGTVSGASPYLRNITSTLEVKEQTERNFCSFDGADDTQRRRRERMKRK